MDRVLISCLARWYVSSGGGDLFVIGATNRPDLLDGSFSAWAF